MKIKYKAVLTVLAIFILLLVAIFLVPSFFKKEEKVPVKVVDSIEKYGYTLEDRDTKLMKDTYNELKDILNENEVNYEEYAKTLTKLFIIDLFTIDNKRNSYDVGGYEFIYPDNVENYKINVEDTLYKTVKSNSDSKRVQELPIVSSVEIESIESSDFIIGETDTYKAFVINANWSYETDLGYDNKATITCIEKENKIYIVEYKVGE